MDTSHCHHRDYILLLLLSYSFVFGLASNIDVSNDARGGKTDNPLKGGKYSIENGTDTGKEYIMCAESTMKIPWELPCDKSSKDVITKINFADYGNPSGKCEHYRHGNCGAPATMKVVKKNCLGKHKCVFVVSDEMFGTSHCIKDKHFFVEVTCTKA